MTAPARSASPLIAAPTRKLVKSSTDIRFQPVTENVEIYDQFYREVYLKMYSRPSALYHSIREITGYPY